MSLAAEFLATYSAADYARESRLIARDAQWSRRYLQPNGWTVIPANAKRPAAIASVDNAMRSRVERYRIFTESPDIIGAYIGTPCRNGGYPVTVWTGEPIGNATLGSKWRVNSYVGSHMCQFYARINGREYTGRGFGEGMCITLRETAESRRKNPRQGVAT